MGVDPARRRNSANRIKLTEERVRTLRKPEVGAAYTYDTLAPSLAVRVSPGGTKTYVVVKKIHGRPQRITLGRFPDLRLDEARSAAAVIAAEIAHGRDPVATRKAAKARRATMADIWADYRSTPRAQLRSANQLERLWISYVQPALGSVPIVDVSRGAVHRLVDDVGRTKPVQANRVLALTSVLLGHAVRLEHVTTNVASGVSRFPETARARVLRRDELPTLLEAINAEPQPWRDLFLMLFYTGARRAAVAGMRWEDIDFAAELWTIPATASKNKEATAVPLPALAMRLLSDRLERRAGERWVFPSPVGDQPVVGLAKSWRRVLTRANISDLRIHDVRRTSGTTLARHGASPHQIANSLGHRSINSARTYVRLAGEDARHALSTAVGALIGSGGTAKILSGQVPDGVTDLLRRRVTAVLHRHDVPVHKIGDLVDAFIAETSWAVAGVPFKSPHIGRPADYPAGILAARVPEILARHGVNASIWRQCDDEQGRGGEVSLAAEIEAIAQTALRDARPSQNASGLEARPARISTARKVLQLEQLPILGQGTAK